MLTINFSALLLKSTLITEEKTLEKHKVTTFTTGHIHNIL